MQPFLAALARTVVEAADSKKAMSSLVATVFAAVSAIVVIPDPTVRGVVVALSTAIIVAAYVIAQAYSDAHPPPKA